MIATSNNSSPAPAANPSIVNPPRSRSNPHPLMRTKSGREADYHCDLHCSSLSRSSPQDRLTATSFTSIEAGRPRSASRVRGPKVTLHPPGGPVEFDASDFRAIVPGHDPANEWPDRLAKAKRAGPADLFATAWWALENGLTADAVATLRSVHTADPKLEPVASLLRMLDRVSPPLADPDALASTLPSGPWARCDPKPALRPVSHTKRRGDRRPDSNCLNKSTPASTSHSLRKAGARPAPASGSSA